MTPSKQQSILAEIKAAWDDPVTAGWNPNVAPVLRVSVDKPCRVLTASQALLALPPAYKPPRHVTFQIEFGMIDGVRVYRVMATLDGMRFQITTGPCA